MAAGNAPVSKTETPIRRVAILFAGGPAPAANAVISTAANSFLRAGIEVLGIMHGYSFLVEYKPSAPLQEGKAYKKLDAQILKRTRNSAGIIIGTVLGVLLLLWMINNTFNGPNNNRSSAGRAGSYSSRQSRVVYRDVSRSRSPRRHGVKRPAKVYSG